MIDVEETIGIRLIGRVEVPPELWAAMHSAAMKEDVGQGGAYDSRLNGPVRTVADPGDPPETKVNALINVWATPENKPKNFPAAEDMTGKVNGAPCEYVGAWTSVGVNKGKYIVERDVKALSNPQEDSDDRERLMETAQKKGGEILKEAKNLNLPVEPVVVWNPAGSTIEWVEEKWSQLQKAAVQELPTIDRAALCPVCKEWELEGEKPVKEFISHLREDHDLKVTGERTGCGNISVWTPGGTLAPVYQRIV